MSGHAAIDRMIAGLEALPGHLTSAAAPELATALEVELRSQIASGVGPDGKSWAPTRDGAQALPNAARDLEVSASGKLVIATLGGVHARHHFGAVKGGVRRQILPSSGVPATVARAFESVLNDRFARATGSR